MPKSKLPSKPSRKLPPALMLAVLLALCALLSACSAPAGSSGGELGGLMRVSLTEPAAGPPGSFFLPCPCRDRGPDFSQPCHIPA